MNVKQRKALLIAAIAQGMDVRIYAAMPIGPGRKPQIIRTDFRQLHVDRVTAHNIYLDNVRHSWTGIAGLVHRGEAEFFHAGIAVAWWIEGQTTTPAQ